MKRIFLSLFMAFILSGCGFHLIQNDVPDDFKELQITNSSGNKNLLREVKRAFNFNKIKWQDFSKDKKLIPSLIISSSSFDKKTVSLYYNGKSAEYQMVLSVYASISADNDDNYPVNVKIYRSFFDNPVTALAKSTEQQFLQSEMYNEAARLLINKIKKIKTKTP